MGESGSGGGPLPPESSSTLYRAGGRRGSRRPRGAWPGWSARERVVRPRGYAWRRVKVIALVLAVLAVLDVAGTYLWAQGRLRQTAAMPEDEGRPEPGEGTNWLVIGTDTRSGLTKRERDELHVGGADERNTDTMMLLHHGEAGPYLVSLPRDSYVDVPGRGRAKLNSAYATGGPRLLTRTVEQATGLRVDHYAEVDFLGFVDIVDAMGGVDLCLDEPLRDEKAGADLDAGCQELDGKQALGFVRARYTDAAGDLGRVRRQQQLLAAMVREATGPGALLNPFAFFSLAGSVLDAVTVDNGTGVLSLTWMAWQVRGLTGGDGGTTTVPVADAGLDVAGMGDVVLWDSARARALFDQLRRDVPITATRVR
ncbi:LCP family protein [Streptomyces sp. HNM0574]|uniref:LCP family protein n=1 Tax=Streptomyces sp. HNM0574 TaxID=2714954 RepID=UPI00146E7D39|nr:LCP family protein [Streptomyces sp. HNM0574]NLU70890.1 LCP family protein [Streptomyces sp. HNM0574]